MRVKSVTKSCLQNLCIKKSTVRRYLQFLRSWIVQRVTAAKPIMRAADIPAIVAELGAVKTRKHHIVLVYDTSSLWQSQQDIWLYTIKNTLFIRPFVYSSSRCAMFCNLNQSSQQYLVFVAPCLLVFVFFLYSESWQTFLSVLVCNIFFLKALFADYSHPVYCLFPPLNQWSLC